jgi:hypothetical protein
MTDLPALEYPVSRRTKALMRDGRALPSFSRLEAVSVESSNSVALWVRLFIIVSCNIIHLTGSEGKHYVLDWRGMMTSEDTRDSECQAPGAYS